MHPHDPTSPVTSHTRRVGGRDIPVRAHLRHHATSLLDTTTLHALNAELDIPITSPQQWQDVRELAHLLVYQKALHLTPSLGSRAASDQRADMAGGAALRVINGLETRLGHDRRPGKPWENITSLSRHIHSGVTTAVKEQINTFFHGKSSSDTASALYELTRRLSGLPDPTPGLVKRVGEQILTEFHRLGKHPEPQFWTRWRRGQPLLFDSNAMDSTEDSDPQASAAVARQADRTGGQHQPSLENEALSRLDARSPATTIVDNWEYIDQFVRAQRMQRLGRSSVYADDEIRATAQYQANQRCAALLSGIEPMIRCLGGLAVFAQHTGAHMVVPKPGLLTDNQAARLTRRFSKSRDVLAAVTAWEEGDDASELFAPFGDLPIDQEETIINFLTQAPPRMRVTAVHAWIAMASASHKEIATALTDPNGGPTLVDLAHQRTGA